ncbi:hypothetical protein Pcinc_037894 [Petrolisthes cinctipes]|uniref:Uncharacterized protein n=1 Tax=Petrolisthes cinctipes TaxID=88211 RepID=A0AAE1BT56_PETCI|nr:hypothetical protein Pcinc_037894 [Petrolisthes cinctipes]
MDTNVCFLHEGLRKHKICCVGKKATSSPFRTRCTPSPHTPSRLGQCAGCGQGHILSPSIWPPQPAPSTRHPPPDPPVALLLMIDRHTSVFILSYLVFQCVVVFLMSLRGTRDLSKI